MSCGPGTTGRTEHAANLIIAGVGKSGTTSLFHHLGSHPDICPATVKETHFFSPLCHGQPVGPLTEYEAFFAGCRGERYRLEATPDYCTGGAALIAALEEHLAAPRVILVLRDPVERLRDNFWYMRSKLRAQGFESFEAYVDDCLRQRELGLDRSQENRSRSWIRNFYDGFVGEWLDAFGDRLRIVFFEHMIADPEATAVDLCQWLDLDPDPLRGRPFLEHNPTRQPRHRGLQRVAVSANRLGGGFLARHPALKIRLRGLYRSVNETALEGERHTDPAVAARIAEAVRPSNHRVAARLRQAGYERFPAWLRDAEGSIDG